jgi:formyltetrahydrofolate-dependent phosphoribosylglycinamide formyltransferase
MKRIVVLISGNGSNLQAIIDATENEDIPNAKVVGVISNRKDAYGLKRAEQHHIEHEVFSLRQYLCDGKGNATREEYNILLHEKVQKWNPDIIVLAGWMLVMSESFLVKCTSPIINIHPALPGQFVGAKAIENAFKAYQKGKISKTGVMVHKVMPDLDSGEVIISEEIPIDQNETLQSLTNKVHAVEHRLVVTAIKKILLL